MTVGNQPKSKEHDVSDQSEPPNTCATFIQDDGDPHIPDSPDILGTLAVLQDQTIPDKEKPRLDSETLQFLA